MSQRFEMKRIEPTHPLERLALDFVHKWFEHPVFHDSVWHEGINLAELNEYEIFGSALSALIRHQEQDSQ